MLYSCICVVSRPEYSILRSLKWGLSSCPNSMKNNSQDIDVKSAVTFLLRGPMLCKPLVATLRSADKSWSESRGGGWRVGQAHFKQACYFNFWSVVVNQTCHLALVQRKVHSWLEPRRRRHSSSLGWAWASLWRYVREGNKNTHLPETRRYKIQQISWLATQYISNVQNCTIISLSIDGLFNPLSRVRNRWRLSISQKMVLKSRCLQVSISNEWGKWHHLIRCFF